ncbi:Uncharacterised protein [Candidatus Gugararchaeum adminiculabundum]|nr:Uncharacterised protein [Candidatus Gugararchaeum adminiculabundum]
MEEKIENKKTNARARIPELVLLSLLVIASFYVPFALALPAIPTASLQIVPSGTITALPEDTTSVPKTDLGSGFGQALSCDASSIFSFSWLPMALVAILAVILMLALAYMMSVIFALQPLAVWAKNEASQIAVTTLLIILLLPSTQVFSNLGCAIHKENTFDRAIGYVKSVRMKLLVDFGALTSLNVFIGLISSVQINLTPLRMGVFFSFGSAFKPILDWIGIGSQAMLLGIGEMTVHELALYFVRDQMFALFLPLGIFLRSTPFTRRTGSALIAIAIGLYFVLPITLLVNQVIYDDHYGRYADDFAAYAKAYGLGDVCAPTQTSSLAAPCLSRSIASPILIYVHNFMTHFGLLTIMGLAFGVLAQAATAPLIVAGMVTLVFSVANDLIFMLVIFCILLPIINITLTLSFIASLAKALDSDINLSALTKLI